MVTGKKSAPLAVKLRDGKHEWTSGLDAKLGGAEEGPDPHQLLESALVACTALTVQLYANRKGWPLERADVSVRITQEGEGGNRIHRDVAFLGDLSDEQRARLLEIADKCPIHRFLSKGAVIETVLQGSGMNS